MSRPSDQRRSRVLMGLLCAGLLPLLLSLVAIPAMAGGGDAQIEQGPVPPITEVDELALGEGGGGGGGSSEGDPDDPLDFGNSDHLALIEQTIRLSILLGI